MNRGINTLEASESPIRETSEPAVRPARRRASHVAFALAVFAMFMITGAVPALTPGSPFWGWVGGGPSSESPKDGQVTKGGLSEEPIEASTVVPSLDPGPTSRRSPGGPSILATFTNPSFETALGAEWAGSGTSGWSVTRVQDGPQSVVSIGTGTSTDSPPLDIFYNYHRSQMLYTGAEIGGPGTITKIAFYVGSASADTLNTFELHMAMTTATSLTTWQSTATHTLVYSANYVTPGVTGWQTITLTTPFVFDDTKNLLVSTRHQDGTWESAYSQYRYTTTTNSFVTGASDTINPPTAGASSNRPNVQFTVAVAAVGWPTHGSWSAQLFSNNGALSIGQQYRVAQTLDLTGWDTMKFDIWGYTTGTTSLMRYRVLIDGAATSFDQDQLISENAVYLDRSLDLTSYPGTHTVAFQLYCDVASANAGSRYLFVDNIRLESSRPYAPVLSKPFDNQRGGGWTNTLRPVFQLSATDPQADNVHLHIQVDDESTFTSPYTIDADSSVSSTGFSGTPPYTSGSTASYTAQSNLASQTTFYWRAQAKDGGGFGPWASAFSYTSDSAVTDEDWFQTTKTQFDTDTPFGAGMTSTTAAGGTYGAGAIQQAEAFTNPGFQSAIGSEWTYSYSSSPSGSQFLNAGRVTGFNPTGCPPDGSTAAYEIDSGTATRDMTLGEWAEVSQNIDLTNVNSILFDLCAYNTGSTAGIFAYRVYVDDTTLCFSQNQLASENAAYGNRETDLCTLPSGVHKVSFRLHVIAGATGVGIREMYVDKVRTKSMAYSTAILYSDAPATATSWDKVTWAKDGSSTGSVTVKIQKNTGSWVDTGISGTTSPISITSLTTEAQLRLVVTMSPATVAPKLYDWGVSWRLPVNHFHVTQTIGTQTAGVVIPSSITFTAHTAGHMVATDFTGAVTISAPAAPAGQTITPTSVTFTSGDLGVHVQGAGTITVYRAGTGASGNQITATSGSASGSSNQFDVSPAAFNKFVFDPAISPTSYLADDPISVTVHAADTYGNWRTDTTSNTLSASPADGQMTPTSISVASGVWSGTVRLRKAQTTQLTTTDGTRSGTSGSLTINPGPLSTFTWSGVPASFTAGVPVSSITLTAKDAWGNVRTGHSGTVAVTVSNGGTVTTTPSPVSSWTSGVATITVELRLAGTTLHLTATQGIATDSGNFDVIAAAHTSFGFSTILAQVAGVNFTITVRAEDAYGNLKSGFNGQANMSDTTGTITPTISPTFINGVATFEVNITTSGSGIQITASMTGASGSSNSFNVLAGPTHHFEFVTITSPKYEGIAFLLEARAVDRLGNVNTGFGGTATLTVSIGTITPTGGNPITFGSGVWNQNVVLSQNGTDVVITATGSGFTGNSNPFNVLGGLHHFDFGTVPTPQTAGASFTVTVVAKDQSGNTLTAFTGLVDLSDSTGSLTPAVSGAFTSGSWTGSATITTASSGGSITAINGTKTGTSNSFEVIAAAHTGFSFDSISSPQFEAEMFYIRIRAIDAYGNTVPDYSGVASLSVSGNTIAPTTTSSGTNPTFASGEWADFVTITNAQVNAAITATDTPKTGTSNTFNVNPPSKPSVPVLTYPFDNQKGGTDGANPKFGFSSTDPTTPTADDIRYHIQIDTAPGFSSGSANGLFNDTFPTTTLDTTNKWTITAQPTGVVVGTNCAYHSASYSTALGGVVGLSTVIETKVVDVSTYNSATLTYWWRQGVGNPPCDEPNNNEDFFVHYLRSDGAWIQIQRIAGSSPGSTTWQKVTYSIPTNGIWSGLKIKFTSSGSSGAGSDLWAIDDVDISVTGASMSAVSGGTAGCGVGKFCNTNNPTGDANPFTSGEPIEYIHSTSLGAGLYWWRVRATDPTGTGLWSLWSTPYSFIVDTAALRARWHQTSKEQFQEGTLSSSVVATTTGGGQVELTGASGQLQWVTETEADFETGTTPSGIDTNTTSGQVLVTRDQYLTNGNQEAGTWSSRETDPDGDTLFQYCSTPNQYQSPAYSSVIQTGGSFCETGGPTAYDNGDYREFYKSITLGRIAPISVQAWNRGYTSGGTSNAVYMRLVADSTVISDLLIPGSSTPLTVNWALRSGTYSPAGTSVTIMLRLALTVTGSASYYKVVWWDDVAAYQYKGQGKLTSKVFDSTYATADWQTAAVVQTLNGGTTLYETRSGNTLVPDGSWSAWQALSGTTIQSPDSRYLQYRATLNAPSNAYATPSLDRITVAYAGVLTPGSDTGPSIKYTSGPTDRTGWHSVKWSENAATGDVTVAIQKDVSGVWTWTGLQSTTSPISLDGVATGLNLRAIANLTPSGGSPALLDWEVLWNTPPPMPGALVNPPDNGEAQPVVTFDLDWLDGTADYEADTKHFRAWRKEQGGSYALITMSYGDTESRTQVTHTTSDCGKVYVWKAEDSDLRANSPWSASPAEWTYNVGTTGGGAASVGVKNLSGDPTSFTLGSALAVHLSSLVPVFTWDHPGGGECQGSGWAESKIRVYSGAANDCNAPSGAEMASYNSPTAINIWNYNGLNLAPGAFYTFCVQEKKVSGNWSPWTGGTFRTNTAPIAESLGVTAGSGAMQHVTVAIPTFTWTFTDPDGALDEPPGAPVEVPADSEVRYRVMVWSGLTCGSGLRLDDSLEISGSAVQYLYGSSTFAEQILVQGADYLLCVDVYDGYQWSGEASALFHRNGAPAGVQPISPAMYATTSGTQVNLSWLTTPDPEGDPVTYFYEWKRAVSPTWNVSNTSAITATITPQTIGCRDSMVWRIKTFDGYEIGPYGPTFTFNHSSASGIGLFPSDESGYDGTRYVNPGFSTTGVGHKFKSVFKDCSDSGTPTVTLFTDQNPETGGTTNTLFSDNFNAASTLDSTKWDIGTTFVNPSFESVPGTEWTFEKSVGNSNDFHSTSQDTQGPPVGGWPSAGSYSYKIYYNGANIQQGAWAQASQNIDLTGSSTITFDLAAWAQGSSTVSVVAYQVWIDDTTSVYSKAQVQYENAVYLNQRTSTFSYTGVHKVSFRLIGTTNQNNLDQRNVWFDNIRFNPGTSIVTGACGTTYPSNAVQIGDTGGTATLTKKTNQNLASMTGHTININFDYRTKAASSTVPPGRHEHTAVYDAANNRMIMFGGYTGSAYRNDVWVLSYANGLGGTPAWTNTVAQGASGSPVARSSHSAVYDPGSNRMILFGGGNPYNDVWVLTNANGLGGASVWTQLIADGAAGSPAKRYGHRAIYDTYNKKMAIFAGVDNSGTKQNDVWYLSNADGTGGTPTWTQLSPTGTKPSVREYSSIVYDSSNDKMIVFGGRDGSAVLKNDVWVLSKPFGGGASAWTNTIAQGQAGSPSARWRHSAEYNESTGKMVIFGGKDSATLRKDVWVLTSAIFASGTWANTISQTASGAPSARQDQTSVYNATQNRMTIFGGDDGAKRNDVWVLAKADGTGGTSSFTNLGFVSGCGNPDKDLLVQVSSDGGTVWNTTGTVPKSNPSESYVTKTIQVPQQFFTSTFKFRFFVNAISPGAYWYVDNVYLNDTSQGGGGGVTLTYEMDASGGKQFQSCASGPGCSGLPAFVKGTHSFYFRIVTPGGVNLRSPATGSHNGPDVGINGGATLRLGLNLISFNTNRSSFQDPRTLSSLASSLTSQISDKSLYVYELRTQEPTGVTRRVLSLNNGASYAGDLSYALSYTQSMFVHVKRSSGTEVSDTYILPGMEFSTTEGFTVYDNKTMFFSPTNKSYASALDFLLKLSGDKYCYTEKPVSPCPGGAGLNTAHPWGEAWEIMRWNPSSQSWESGTHLAADGDWIWTTSDGMPFPIEPGQGYLIKYRNAGSGISEFWTSI